MYKLKIGRKGFVLIQRLKKQSLNLLGREDELPLRKAWILESSTFTDLGSIWFVKIRF
jgi:hypothetical protein